MSGLKTLGLATAVLFVMCQAALAGLISGKITEISKDGATITVETTKGSQKFKLAESLAITLDDRKIERDQLSVGMRVSVFTDSANKPSKLVARTDSPKPLPAKTETPKSSRSPSSSRTVAAEPGDWPQYLGPNRDNISHEKGLLRTWPEEGPTKLWTADGLGAGYSSVATANGRIYTMGNRNGSQSLLAMDFESGNGLWERAVGREFSEGNGNGPRGTPAVIGDKVYGLGANGELLCANTKDGVPVWNLNILQQFGGKGLGWGISESVLIDGDRLICTPGGPQATMVALDRNTGRTMWTAKTGEGDTAGYASPIKIEVGGVEQYVTFTNRGTIGVRAKDGEMLWRDNAAANGTANCSTPQFFENMVFSASGYGQGGAMVRLASNRGTTTATFAYHSRDMKSHHGGFVILDGYVYGSNEGVFVCMDLESGDVKWQSRAPGKGSLTCVDGMLIVRSESGPVTLVQASPLDYKELGRFDQPERSGNSAWAYPVVSHGRLFLRDMEKLLCYDLRKE